RTITIRQTAYVKEVCRRYGTEGVLGAVPYASSRHLDGREKEAIVEDVPYREVVGSLMWAAVMTRLDIANAVREVAKYSAAPKRVHWNAALSIVAYLQAYPDLGMTYGGVQECVISAYADASYAGDGDNRRSVTGGAVMFCGAAVAWMSKMQKVVALSSTESEYIALS
ncbi:unnamed protein product, partial [Discosporangium mesarthrocarpum]